MADSSTQNFSNYTRYDPPFHFFVLPVFGLLFLGSVVHLIMRPRLHTALLVVVAMALLVAVIKSRMYPLKVQDRVIRLEERLRLAMLIDPALRPRNWGVDGIAADRAALFIGRGVTRAGGQSAE